MPAAALSEKEKERVRYHLGYLLVSSAPSIQLGIPRPLQTVFLLEQSLTLLTNEFALERVRCILETLEALEAQLRASACTTAAASLGDLTLHPLAQKGLLYPDSLEREYGRWAFRLADVMGAPIYPYARRFRRGGPGSNVPVLG